MELQHRTLEQMLLEQGRISAEDLRRVKRLQQERGERLERLLLDLGFISEEDLLPLLATYLGVEPVQRRDFPAEPVPLGPLSYKYLRHAKVLPLSQQNGTLVVAMADPADYYTIQGLRLATGLEILPRLARERDVLEQLDAAYGGGNGNGGGEGADAADGELEFLSDDEEDVNHLRDLASEAPVIRLVNMLINRAVEQRASDIHIEPFENELKVRYRIDGVLHDVETPQRRLQAAIVSRIKIMAKLNIAERRLPQDGRIKLRLMGREIDLRVSTLPTLYGESVVLRILDRSNIVVNLDSLGFNEDTLEGFSRLITKPYGMVLVTGPTGSGKTTTLYGALDKINSPDKKIITIEDPVEYQLFGVNQIHVKPAIGLTFANGLRSIVRQDPDVIMVGEIRDAETAEIADPGGAHRPPRVLDAAHERRRRRRLATTRDGRRGLPPGVVAARRAGAAPRPARVRQVPEAGDAGAGRRARGRGLGRGVRGGRLRGVLAHGIPRARGHLRDPRHERRGPPAHPQTLVRRRHPRRRGRRGDAHAARGRVAPGARRPHDGGRGRPGHAGGGLDPWACSTASGGASPAPRRGNRQGVWP
jgi:hypothetical protein